MSLRNPTSYRNHAAKVVPVPGWLYGLEAESRRAKVEEARQQRVLHPKKKQPRHVRESLR